MFDIRAGIYSRDSDTGRYSFFDTNRHVIASCRLSGSIGNARMAELDGPFARSAALDVVMVDEAHHLNSTEKN